MSFITKFKIVLTASRSFRDKIPKSEKSKKKEEETHINVTECFSNYNIVLSGPIPCWYFVPVPSSAKRRKELFYLTTHSTHFIYGYMA